MAADIALLLCTLAGVAAGYAALAWMRLQRQGVSPPQLMLSMGFAGMLLGLLLDLGRAGAAPLGALCAQAGSLDLVQAVQLHLLYLPGMHAGMLAGGLLAIPVLRRLRPHCKRYLCSLFTQNLLCSGWMLLGMSVGGLWLSRGLTPPGASALSAMLAGMFVGMTWGMVASVALYRAFFTLRNLRRDARPHQRAA
jgi:hypothetical protein